MAGGLLGTPLASLAQPSNAITCGRLPSETLTSWTDRCNAQARRAREAEEAARADNEARKRAIGQQLADTDRLRKALEPQPALPAARNRLLGRWQSSTSKPAPSSDPFAGMAAMLTGCGVLLGDGIVEFTPDRWAIYDSDGRNDMGAISYRAGANGEIYGLPAQGSIFNLLPFQFESADRIRLLGVVCTLARVKDAAPATGLGGAPPASGRAAASPGPGRATASAAVPAAAPGGGLLMIKDKVGYQCPDGQQLAIQSCDRACLVVRVDQPPRNGFEVTFIDTPDALLKRVASCKQRGLGLKDGVLVLTP